MVLVQIPHTPPAVRNDKPFPVHRSPSARSESDWVPLTPLTMRLKPLLCCCHPERSEAGRPPAGGDLNLPLLVIPRENEGSGFNGPGPDSSHASGGSE